MGTSLPKGADAPACGIPLEGDWAQQALDRPRVRRGHMRALQARRSRMPGEQSPENGIWGAASQYRGQTCWELPSLGLQQEPWFAQESKPSVCLRRLGEVGLEPCVVSVAAERRSFCPDI